MSGAQSSAAAGSPRAREPDDGKAAPPPGREPRRSGKTLRPAVTVIGRVRTKVGESVSHGRGIGLIQRKLAERQFY